MLDKTQFIKCSIQIIAFEFTETTKCADISQLIRDPNGIDFSKHFAPYRTDSDLNVVSVRTRTWL